MIPKTFKEYCQENFALIRLEYVSSGQSKPHWSHTGWLEYKLNHYDIYIREFYPELSFSTLYKKMDEDYISYDPKYTEEDLNTEINQQLRLLYEQQ